jgi:hypothetical protein
MVVSEGKGLLSCSYSHAGWGNNDGMLSSLPDYHQITDVSHLSGNPIWE